jgi:hypothetical protein
MATDSELGVLGFRIGYTADYSATFVDEKESLQSIPIYRETGREVRRLWKLSWRVVNFPNGGQNMFKTVCCVCSELSTHTKETQFI